MDIDSVRLLEFENEIKKRAWNCNWVVSVVDCEDFVRRRPEPVEHVGSLWKK
jgi:hypothetical protein